MRREFRGSELPQIDGARVAVLRSSWCPEAVESMTTACVDALNDVGAADIEIHTVPGSFELPFAARYLIEKSGPFDAIICFGVVLKGSTLHFDLVSREVARGLAEVSWRTTTPVLYEVLSVLEIEDAFERAQPDELNKGLEGAAAAAQMIAWCRRVSEIP